MQTNVIVGTRNFDDWLRVAVVFLSAGAFVVVVVVVVAGAFVVVVETHALFNVLATSPDGQLLHAV